MFGQRERKFAGVRRIAVLASPPVEELDVVGPWEVFTTANSVIHPRKAVYEMVLLTTAQRQIIEGDSRLHLHADMHYREFSGDLDTVVVPGGSGPLRSRDRGVLNWLNAQSKNARRVVSGCTGAFLLARAGLLEGGRATTHWKYADALKKQFPGIDVQADRIYIRHGRVYTSAGVTAGMDLALALVEEDLGSAVALKVAQMLVVFLRRPGGQRQFSAGLLAQATDSQPIRELLLWMSEDLRRDLSVENLASRLAMSPRNFARVFVRETGRTPGRFVEQLRTEAARRSLESSGKSIKEIAAATGFSSPELLRRAFHRFLKIPRGAYRDRFRRSLKSTDQHLRRHSE